MSFIPTPNAARVAVEGLLGTKPCINTMWFLQSTPYTPSELDDLCSMVATEWSAWAVPHLNPRYSYTGVTAYAQDSDVAPVGLAPAATPFIGTDPNGIPAPDNVAACVTFYTATRGRSGRGRVFLGGLSMGNLSDPDHLVAGIRSDYEAIFGHIKFSATTLGSVMVVVSHQHNNVKLAQGVARAITSFTCNARVDTMRNRLGKA